MEEKVRHGHSLKGRAPHSQENMPRGFYFYPGHITLRMVLIYYAQIRFRWLPFTENKGEDVANYIKKEGHLQISG